MSATAVRTATISLWITASRAVSLCIPCSIASCVDCILTIDFMFSLIEVVWFCTYVSRLFFNKS